MLLHQRLGLLLLVALLDFAHELLLLPLALGHHFGVVQLLRRLRLGQVHQHQQRLGLDQDVQPAQTQLDVFALQVASQSQVELLLAALDLFECPFLARHARARRALSAGAPGLLEPLIEHVFGVLHVLDELVLELVVADVLVHVGLAEVVDEALFVEVVAVLDQVVAEQVLDAHLQVHVALRRHQQLQAHVVHVDFTVHQVVLLVVQADEPDVVQPQVDEHSRRLLGLLLLHEVHHEQLVAEVVVEHVLFECAHHCQVLEVAHHRDERVQLRVDHHARVVDHARLVRPLARLVSAGHVHVQRVRVADGLSLEQVRVVECVHRHVDFDGHPEWLDQLFGGVLGLRRVSVFQENLQFLHPEAVAVHPNRVDFEGVLVDLQDASAVAELGVGELHAAQTHADALVEERVHVHVHFGLDDADAHFDPLRLLDHDVRVVDLLVVFSDLLGDFLLLQLLLLLVLVALQRRQQLVRQEPQNAQHRLQVQVDVDVLDRHVQVLAHAVFGVEHQRVLHQEADTDQTVLECDLVAVHHRALAWG